MAINVTQRLQKVSKTTADIREAPRGLAQQNNPASELSAKKLLKIRRRLGIPDAEQMACMTQCVMISPAKRKSHGTLNVRVAVGFVAKVFGLKQQEVLPYTQVTEVLRETFQLKKEEGGIEMVLGAGTKAFQFFPQHVDEAFEAINRCRFASSEKRAEATDETFAHDPHAQQKPEADKLKDLMAKATCERYKAGDLVIEDEHARTTAAILDVLEQEELLASEPTLQRSIRLRNPYVDPMSFLQADALGRWRECGRADEALERLLVQTVRGIARGLRNTG